MSFPLLAAVLWAFPVSAEELSLTLDAPPVASPRAFAAPTLIDAASLNVPLSLDLPLTQFAASPRAQNILTAPALPKTAVPAAQAGAQTARAAEIRSARPQSLEQASADAAVRFDKALSSSDGDEGSAANWKLTFGAGQAAEYRRAVAQASRSGWTQGGAEVRDAGLVLLESAGVAAEPIVGKNRGKDTPALRVTPVLGKGPLNDLAFHLKKGLDVDLDYLPERTGDAVGAFSSREKRLMVSHFDRPEFFIGLLHEARHAYYASLLAKGEVRLFHSAIVARPGRTVSPYAKVYANYISLEELSTFPKTLKHLLSAIRDADPGTAAKLQPIAGVRILQYAEFLGTTLHLTGQIDAVDGRGNLSLRRMEAEESARAGLDPLTKGSYYALELSQAVFYMPFETGDSRTWLQRRLGARDQLALDSLRLKARLLRELAEKNVEATKAYKDALARFDFAEAGKQADRLIKATVEADRDWRLGYETLLARRE